MGNLLVLQSCFFFLDSKQSKESIDFTKLIFFLCLYFKILPESVLRFLRVTLFFGSKLHQIHTFDYRIFFIFISFCRMHWFIILLTNLYNNDNARCKIIIRGSLINFFFFLTPCFLNIHNDLYINTSLLFSYVVFFFLIVIII